MIQITRQALGERLRDVRKFLGLTQGELAEKMELSQITVSRVERGMEVGVENTLSFIAFYAKLINIETIFEDLYDPSSIMRKDTVANSIVAEKLRRIVEDLNREEQKFVDFYNSKIIELNSVISFIEEEK